MLIRLVKKMYSATVDICLPAILFAFCVFYYCDKAISYENEPMIFHTLYYTLISVWLLYVYFHKRSREGILGVFLLTCYVVLNKLNQKFTISFDKTAEYQILSLLLLFDWGFYLVAEFFQSSKKYDFYFLCFLLLQASLIENIDVFPITYYGGGFKLGIALLWLITVFFYVVYVSLFPNTKRYGTFFAFLCFALGFFNSESCFALSIYFSFAILILLISTIYADIYRYYRDCLTGVYSLNTYLRHSKKFPLKYSLAIICIDDYLKLLKVFGARNVDVLTKLVMKKITQLSQDAEIYRYNDDEFILIFKNVDKKQCFEYLEDIRRSIAASEFVLKPKQVVKITISAGVSEKKRSDADVEPVLMRTREAVQRTYKFTQNMTSKA